MTGSRFSLSTFSFSIPLFLLLTLAGCLPSSCRRTESRAVSPADSLSRRIAAQLTPDTLRLLWQTAGPEGHRLEFPRTARFAPDGRLFVSDVERNSVYVFAGGGAFVEETTWEGADVPYLAGLRADTLLVFSAEARRLDFLVDGTPARSLNTPAALPRGPLQYLAATDDALYFKAVGDDGEGYLARLDEHGAITARVALPGPAWRHAGLLRVWGDSLLSLSGYLPVLDVLSPDLARPPDSMALVGFDSPMLPRTYAFLHGDAYEAPLLSSSAVPVGNWLFVLNLRPGWLQIDVYDRAGRLRHLLVQEDPGFDPNFYPVDLAAHAPEPGRFEFAIVTGKPNPTVKLYHWQMPQGATSP